MPLSGMHKKRRGRNFAIAGALLFMVALVFLVTIVKLQVPG